MVPGGSRAREEPADRPGTARRGGRGDRDDEPVATPVSSQDEAAEAVASAGTSDEQVRPTHAARYVPEEPDARRAAPVGHHRAATGEDEVR